MYFKVVDPMVVLGTGLGAGPDEDDFHTFKRRTAEVDRDEKQTTKMKQMLELRAGAHSGVVKAFGNIPAMAKKNKVVVFK
jgi:zinc finger CCHC domain-containing protein 9